MEEERTDTTLLFGYKVATDEFRFVQLLIARISKTDLGREDFQFKIDISNFTLSLLFNKISYKISFERR